MQKFNFILIGAILIFATGCSVYKPFSEAPVKQIPDGTKSIIVDAPIQKTKSAFVDEGVIVEQNSPSQFETKPKDYDWSGSVYCQGFDEDEKTKVVIYVRPDGMMEGVDDARITYEGEQQWKNRVKPAFNWVANIMEKNNLNYKFSN